MKNSLGHVRKKRFGIAEKVRRWQQHRQAWKDLVAAIKRDDLDAALDAALRTDDQEVIDVYKAAHITQRIDNAMLYILAKDVARDVQRLMAEDGER